MYLDELRMMKIKNDGESYENISGRSFPINVAPTIAKPKRWPSRTKDVHTYVLVIANVWGKKVRSKTNWGRSLKIDMPRTSLGVE